MANCKKCGRPQIGDGPCLSCMKRDQRRAPGEGEEKAQQRRARAASMKRTSKQLVARAADPPVATPIESAVDLMPGAVTSAVGPTLDEDGVPYCPFCNQHTRAPTSTERVRRSRRLRRESDG